MGYWQFDHELQVGEQIIFEDMIHYTTVKTNTFNGITHPSIAWKCCANIPTKTIATEWTEPVEN